MRKPHRRRRGDQIPTIAAHLVPISHCSIAGGGGGRHPTPLSLSPANAVSGRTAADTLPRVKGQLSTQPDSGNLHDKLGNCYVFPYWIRITLSIRKLLAKVLRTPSPSISPPHTPRPTSRVGRAKYASEQNKSTQHKKPINCHVLLQGRLSSTASVLLDRRVSPVARVCVSNRSIRIRTAPDSASTPAADGGTLAPNASCHTQYWRPRLDQFSRGRTHPSCRPRP